MKEARIRFEPDEFYGLNWHVTYNGMGRCFTTLQQAIEFCTSQDLAFIIEG